MSATRTSQPCGTPAAYQRGCRCEECRRARSVYTKRLRCHLQPRAFIDRTGTTRRIHGLQALGWTTQHIADAAGTTVATVHMLANRDSPTVKAQSAEAIRAVATRLGGSPGPSAAARRQARRLGYVSLWAWDDDIDNPHARPEGAIRSAHRRPAALTPELLARFGQHTIPVLGGPHIRWTGPVDERGRGRLGCGPKRRRTTVGARRIAFQRHHGRSPAGPVVPACGNQWCVAGPCMVVAGERRSQQVAA